MVFASSSVPVVAEPVRIGEGLFVDGGVRNVTPLQEAFDALIGLHGKSPSDLEEPDQIIVVLASPLEVSEELDASNLESGIEVGKRALELVENEIYINDLRVGSAINDSVRRTLEAGPNTPDALEIPFASHHYANIVVIEPDVAYMDSLEFDPHKIRLAYAAGHDKAADVIGRLARIEAPLERSNVREVVSKKSRKR